MSRFFLLFRSDIHTFARNKLSRGCHRLFFRAADGTGRGGPHSGNAAVEVFFPCIVPRRRYPCRHMREGR